MQPYSPPFSITNRMLSLVAEIAEKTGRITSYRSFETKPYLRRNNRIRSIHSSLAIEANSLYLKAGDGLAITEETGVLKMKGLERRSNFVIFDLPN